MMIKETALLKSSLTGFPRRDRQNTSSKQAKEIEALAHQAIGAKKTALQGQQPLQELLQFCQSLADAQKAAPKYLQPPRQLRLVNSAENCLEIIELAVHWAVERLYGVEGLGPFDEFQEIKEVSECAQKYQIPEWSTSV